MTREDINNIISTICPNDEDFEKPIISPAYLKKELEALALEQETKTGWIPVSERLPANGMDVVFCADNETHSGAFIIGLNAGFYDYRLCKDIEPNGGYFHFSDVIAWMPLPEPYKEE